MYAEVTCTMGELRGVALTPDLRSLARTVLSLKQPDAAGAVGDGRASEDKPRGGNSNDDGRGGGRPTSSSLSTAPPRSASASSPDAILRSARDAKRELTSQSAMTAAGAADLVAGAIRDDGGEQREDAAQVLPLAAVPALKFLIGNSESSDEERGALLRSLEERLSATSLSFAPPPDAGGNKNADPRYLKRLERLRLHDEERSYKKLTTNLVRASKDDDVTAKSMTYAASVGLNMVVAPASFGVFMYFFAGGIFSRFFPPPSDDGDGDEGNNDIDIRRVIAGVVSGVFMLFVEMILFVIRSHELEASVRKKGRRSENRANPFGYTKKNMERVYVRDD